MSGTGQARPAKDGKETVGGRMTRTSDELGVYVHWPFCLKKCPYCDFNSHVRETVEQARWRAALIAEIDAAAAEAPGRRVTSVFFGGGTPSLMPPETAAAVIKRIAERWHLAPDAEITLEANPGAAEAARFEAFRAAGVNRVSIGAQSFDDDALRFLGRIHGANEARRAIEAAHRIFPRVSFDLIYALPGQTAADWRDELSAALALAGGHLSVYQLTIEPGTAFHTDHRLGRFALPAEDDQAGLYETTQEMLDTAGLPAYEISNHARPGEESRHNLIYWRYGDYAGIGPGAHGRLTQNGAKAATRQIRLPEKWLAAVERHGHGREETLPLAPGERAQEMLMMGLRTAEGVEEGRFEREAGQSVDGYLADTPFAELIAEGYLERAGGRLAATADGRQRLNAILAALLA